MGQYAVVTPGPYPGQHTRVWVSTPVSRAVHPYLGLCTHTSGRQLSRQGRSLARPALGMRERVGVYAQLAQVATVLHLRPPHANLRGDASVDRAVVPMVLSTVPPPAQPFHGARCSWLAPSTVPCTCSTTMLHGAPLHRSKAHRSARVCWAPSCGARRGPAVLGPCEEQDAAGSSYGSVLRPQLRPGMQLDGTFLDHSG